MRILPVLFNTEMVCSLLERRKTETRRIVKPQFPEYQDREPGRFSKIVPYGSGSFIATHEEHPNMRTMLQAQYCPGDILYVRETWKVQAAHRFEADARIVFKAGGPMTTINFPGGKSQATSREEYDAFISKWMQGDCWHPSIHMPKEAARIFLRVTDVRAERLQEITDYGVRQEGLGDPETIYYSGALVCEFADLWRKTVRSEDWPKYGWAANPWVWVNCFEPCDRPEGWPSL